MILQKTNFSKLEELLVKNEDKIDKEKMVFNIFLNYTENGKLIDKEIEKLVQKVADNINRSPQTVKLLGGKLRIKSTEEFRKFLNQKKERIWMALQMINDKGLLSMLTKEFEKLTKLDEEKQIEKAFQKECRELLKDTDVYVEKTRISNDHIDMTIYNSREEVEGRSKKSKRELERLNKINQTMGNEGNGLKFLLQSLSLADLEQIMPEKDMGIRLREIILINALLKEGKISKEVVEQILLIDNITYDELMALILKGAISENKIVDLYMQGRIFDVDFEEMLNNGIISHEEFFAATELRTQEKLEETSAIKLSPILKNIPNKKDIIIDVESEKEEDDDWFKANKDNRRKTLIHPAVRYEYLEKLGAKKADVLDIDEDNAFYNYEFFVIPDKNGELNLNSVVIAERFYKDKETQDEYALDNETYFFQYKDLMVNSNLSKQEMTKEREKIVFRANHRSGSWAIRVLYNIAQTMASSNFKEIKNKDAKAHRALDELDKIYSHEKLMSILDLAGEIDDEEKYTYELIDNSFGVKKSNDTNDDNDQITM